MTIGTIILLPFPFAELTNVKVRPAVVVSMTRDRYQDLIVCAVSSVIPASEGLFEIILMPDDRNNLRVPSVVKVDRIVTLKRDSVITTLGMLSESEAHQFREKFKHLAD